MSLDDHGTTLRDEDGIGPIGAATLICEVGGPPRFVTESKFARWSGTGAVALSSGEGTGQPLRHRVDFRGNRTVNSLLYIASITQAREHPDAKAHRARKTAEGKTTRQTRRAHNRHLANRVIRRMWKDERAGLHQTLLLDKEACGSPERSLNHGLAWAYQFSSSAERLLRNPR